MTTTRRRFLTSSALATGSWIAPRFAIGQPGPSANSKINLAFIGVGGRGAINLQGLSGENIVAMCDVDDSYAAESFNAYPKAKRFRDFRVMLDKMGKDIDAVVVSTPDPIISRRPWRRWNSASMYSARSRWRTRCGRCGP